MIKNVCLTCKITFTKPNNPNRKYKFCSYKCSGKSSTLNLTGLQKGHGWNKGIPMTKEMKKKLSTYHLGKPAWNKGIFTKIRECKNCNKQFNGEFRTYCSKVCFKKGTTNENHYNWANGKTPELRRLRNLSPYREWRQLVFNRDDFTCQICGEQENLRANHIKRFINNPKLRTETTNGITICQSCDLTLVLNREKQWESYFNFNLMARGVN